MSESLPRVPCAAERERVRGVFDAAGYREDRIRALLGGPIGAAAARMEPAVLRRRTGDGSRLSVLVRLFLAGIALAPDEVRTALGEHEIATLSAVDLIAAEPAGVLATVQLIPVGGLLIAGDRPQRHFEGAADFVVGPSPVSSALARMTMRRPVACTLDLGCGGGVLALLAAAHSRRVVAADLNPRAVALARFNAALNGLDNVEVVQGDLFEPVRGERFDLIVSNPPFVISPKSAFAYRDGGNGICERIVREAPAHLSRNGCLQMLCNWPQRAASDWRTEVARWFGGTPCNAWVLRQQSLDALGYATAWLSQEFAGRPIPDASLDEWVNHLSQLGIESVGAGLVVMQDTAGRAPWLEVRDAPALAGCAGDGIARVLAARDFLAGATRDDALLDARLKPSPDLEHRAQQRPNGSGWDSAGSQLRLSQGLSFAVRADPVAAAIVGLLDGNRSLREAAQRCADQHGVPVKLFLGQLPAAFRQLMALGLVIPAEA